mgnify:CR=1 FL=1
MEYCPCFLKMPPIIYQSQRKRALSEKELQSLAMQSGLHGDTYPDVETAVTAAKEKANKNDFYFCWRKQLYRCGFIKISRLVRSLFIEKVWEYRRKSFFICISFYT